MCSFRRLCSHYYEAFVVGTTGVFNTRDRAEHTRKRKIIAYAFSPASIGEFEPHMSSNVFRWTQQLDRIASRAPPGGYAKYNAMPWLSYLAFDIIGDLAFGAPFGSKSVTLNRCSFFCITERLRETMLNYLPQW